jgi:hypothetical protein
VITAFVVLPIRIGEKVAQDHPGLPPKLGFAAGIIIQLFVATTGGLTVALLAHLAGLSG